MALITGSFDKNNEAQSTKTEISRLIKEALSEGLIKPFDAETSQRYMKYIPGWA